MNGRMCSKRHVKRELLEQILLADIREGLLSAEGSGRSNAEYGKRCAHRSVTKHRGAREARG